MSRAIVIPVVGPITAVEIPDEDMTGLHALQGIVGGFIEGVAFPGRSDVICYVNEDGKRSCEPNLPATALVEDGLFPSDYIAGPMVIIGADRRTGEHRDLPTDLFMLSTLKDKEL